MSRNERPSADEMELRHYVREAEQSAGDGKNGVQPQQASVRCVKRSGSGNGGKSLTPKCRDARRDARVDEDRGISTWISRVDMLCAPSGRRRGVRYTLTYAHPRSCTGSLFFQHPAKAIADLTALAANAAATTSSLCCGCGSRRLTIGEGLIRSSSKTSNTRHSSSSCPRRASSSGVLPNRVVAFGSAWPASSRLVAARWPSRAAKCSGVSLSFVVAFTSALATSSSCTASSRPANAAACSGAEPSKSRAFTSFA